MRLPDGYWGVGNYVSAGQNYGFDDFLLAESPRREHINSRLLARWRRPGRTLFRLA
jgi:hypothetical protein